MLTKDRGASAHADAPSFDHLLLAHLRFIIHAALMCVAALGFCIHRVRGGKAVLALPSPGSGPAPVAVPGAGDEAPAAISGKSSLGIHGKSSLGLGEGNLLFASPPSSRW